MTRRTGLLAGAAAVVVLAVVAQLTAPARPLPKPAVVPVVSTELICPDARTARTGGVRTVVSAVTPSTLARRVGAGSTGVAVVGTPRRPASIATLTGRRFGAVAIAPADIGAVIGQAAGDRAPGFAMDQLSISTRNTDHGLAGATCTEADNDVWFVGTGSAVGHESTLFLTDPEATPATVDVALYGGNGQIVAPAGLGILVGGNSRRTVRLDLLAPGAGVLAVHVTVSSGRVGAAVLDTQVQGLLPRGADWLPMAEPPARTVVVPGIGGGPGFRRLSLFAPGSGTATVHVTLVGQQGSFAPTGGAASIDLDRGKVTTVDLGPAAASDQSAALVESDVPVVAGLRWTVTSGPIRDLAFSAGTPALDGPAVVAGSWQGYGVSTALMVTAPGAAGRVSVQPLVAGVPRGLPRVVRVGAGSTVRLAMPSAGVTGPYDVVITPLSGSGRLYAAVVRQRVIDRSLGVTVSDVRSSRITVAVPAARPDLDVGLGK